MAAKQTPTAEEVAGAKPDAPAEDDFSVTLERLQAEAYDFLGVDAHIVAGAYAGVSPSTEVSLKDAKKRCADWLKAPTQTDPAQEA